MAAKKKKQIIDSAGRSNVLQKRQLYVVKELNKNIATENEIITQADKGKTLVIIYSKEYSVEVQSFLTANNFNSLVKDPTEKFKKTGTQNVARKQPNYRKTPNKIPDTNEGRTTKT